MIKNDSSIYSESYPVLCLMSTLSIESSKFSNLTFSGASIQIAASNVTLTNVSIEQLSGDDGSEFILGDIGSSITMNDVEYRSSNAML